MSKAVLSLAAITLLLCGLRAIRSEAENRLTADERIGETSQHGFVIVELFTSQGCSSCPAADENLVRIQELAAEKNLPVYVLSMHVDYWNRLGWKDPFSQSVFSQRQRGYAQAFGSTRIYTPQMVINGQTEFVGSDVAKSNEAIKNSLNSTQKEPLEISAKWNKSRDAITFRYNATANSKGKTLVLAIVQKRAENPVDSGENRGRTLAHVNVVLKLETIKNIQITGQETIRVSYNTNNEPLGLIAFVQDPFSQQIMAAKRTDL
ncbi:MAG TPA: DUF1223 domain-containing protein [Planctomycetaceae bacterium]|nr:DUF1223 domain-containing protein [Planctomycetaceae bacterium]